MVLFWFMFITKVSYASPVSQGYKLGYDTCPKSVSGSMVVNCSMFLIYNHDYSQGALRFAPVCLSVSVCPPISQSISHTLGF